MPSLWSRREAMAGLMGASGAVKRVAQDPTFMAVVTTAKQAALMKRGGGRISNEATAIVDVCICIVSVIGSMSIIIPYLVNRRSRKLRHALILGLATSDLVSSLIIVATSGVLIANGKQGLVDAPKFCTFAGYSFATAIWTQHLWNLSIAVVTYVLLVHPLSRFINDVERHIMWLWPIFWAIAMIANGIAWAETGFTDVGGYCSFNASSKGPKFPAIFLFIPRGIVVLVIIVLYAHLFFFLRRTNLFHQVTQQSSSRHSNSRGPGANSEALFGPSRRVSQANALDIEGSKHAGQIKSRGSIASNFVASIKRRFSAPGDVPNTSIDSPDESSTNGDSKRTGSSSTQGKPASITQILNSNDPQSPEDEKINNTEHSPKSRPVETAFDPQLLLPSNTINQHAPISGIQALRRGSAPLPVAYTRRPSTTFMTIPESDALFAHREIFHPSHRDTPVPPSILRDSRSHLSPKHQDLGPRDELPGGEEGAEEDEQDDDESLPGADLLKPMGPRRDARDFGMTSPPQEHLRHYSMKPRAMRTEAGEADVEKGRALDLADILKETQDDNSLPTQTEAQSTYDNVMSDEWTWGMAVAHPTAKERGAGSQLAYEKRASNAISGHQSLKQLHGRRRSSKAKHWFPSRLLRRNRLASESDIGATSSSSSYDEHHVESLGSTLNRQASVLLLLYPAAYVLLFSVSIIRIIVDLSSDATPEEARARQNDALHSISRWTIFAQGAIDALVFQLIERHFRSRMKRRRRIAAGEHVEDLWSVKVWKAAKRVGSRRSSAK